MNNVVVKVGMYHIPLGNIQFIKQMPDRVRVHFKDGQSEDFWLTQVSENELLERFYQFHSGEQPPRKENCTCGETPCTCPF